MNVRLDPLAYHAVSLAAVAEGLEVASWIRKSLSHEVALLAGLPARRRSKREPLPIDVVAIKSLAGHLGELTGSMMMMLERDRLPFARIEAEEVRQILEDLRQAKTRVLECLEPLR